MSTNDLILHTQQNPQKISKTNRILVPKWGWALRGFFLAIIISIIAFVITQAWNIGDPFALYSTIVPIHSVIVLFCGWFIYKNPARGQAGNELVSVIVPVYNQASMIELVIESIFSSSYKNIEVIAVNDGSTDGTKEILDKIKSRYKKLKVIQIDSDENILVIKGSVPGKPGNLLSIVPS